MAACTCC